MGRYLAALLFVCAVASPALAHPPYGLVVDRRGDLYFSDLETVWRLSPDGRLSIFRARVAETHVHELALAPDGSIQGDHNRYEPATQRYFTGLWSRTRTGAEKAIVPMTERPPAGTGVLQDESGNRYVTQRISNDDRRLQLLRRRPSGQIDLLLDETNGASPPIAASVAGVGGMAMGPGGAVYFAAGGKLRRWVRNGGITTVFEGGEGSSLRGIAVTEDGRLFVADMGARAVLAIEANGKARRLYRETGPWLPTAVAFDKKRLFVLEANADPYEYDDRVRVIEVTGNHGKILASPNQSVPTTGRSPSPPTNGRTTPELMVLLFGVLIAAAVSGWLVVRGKRSGRQRGAPSA